MSNALMTNLAERFNVPAQEMLTTLKATCFKGPVTDAQMTALLIVANQYKLNPWTKEIYAFPDKGGIIPVVGVDGWARIINEHPAFDGMDFDMAADGSECTCKIYRKDRSHPTMATEYMAECKRNTQPWQSHPRRMLRHKAMIQAARLAFGFAGIYDQDEAERIPERESNKPADFAAAADTATDTPEIEAIVAELGRLADSGEVPKVQGYFNSLTDEQRKGVGAARWDEIKARTLRSRDARAVDAEVVEVPE